MAGSSEFKSPTASLGLIYQGPKGESDKAMA